MRMIPYIGAKDAVAAVIAGEVTATIADAGPAYSRIKGGQRVPWPSPPPNEWKSFPMFRTMKDRARTLTPRSGAAYSRPEGAPPEIV